MADTGARVVANDYLRAHEIDRLRQALSEGMGQVDEAAFETVVAWASKIRECQVILQQVLQGHYCLAVHGEDVLVAPPSESPAHPAPEEAADAERGAGHGDPAGATHDGA